MFPKTSKYNELISLYQQMAEQGYDRVDGKVTPAEDAFSQVQIVAYRKAVKEILGHFDCKTALDYGAGGGHWDQVEVPEGGTLKNYFGFDTINRFEPARGADGKVKSDVVLCFDVLEHVFMADIPYVVNELFQLANQLIIVNIACYPAAALLPNGENAHISIRPAEWWVGVFDTIATLYPHIAYTVYTSDSHNKSTYHGVRRIKNLIERDGYSR